MDGFSGSFLYLFSVILSSAPHTMAVAIGSYSVLPQSHLTDNGAYVGSVTVSSGQGSASHHRMFRFTRRHASAEVARMVALTQGWLHTCSPRPVMC